MTIVSFRIYTSNNIPICQYRGILCTTKEWRDRNGYPSIDCIAENVTACILSELKKGQSLVPAYDIQIPEMQAMLQSLSVDCPQSYQI